MVRMFDDGELVSEIVPELWMIDGYEPDGGPHLHPPRRRHNGNRPCRVGPRRFSTSGSAAKTSSAMASSATSGSVKTPSSIPGSQTSSPVSTRRPQPATSTAGATMQGAAWRWSSCSTSSPQHVPWRRTHPRRRRSGARVLQVRRRARAGQRAPCLPEDVLVHAVHAQREQGGPTPLRRPFRTACPRAGGARHNLLRSRAQRHSRAVRAVPAQE